MRRWLRRLGRGLALIVLILVIGPALYVALAGDERPALARPLAMPPMPPMPPAGSYRVYLAVWGYHTSILFEQPPGGRMGPPGAEGAPLVEVGWGDRSYFMETDLRPHAVFATLFLPTPTVVYLEGHRAPPRRRNGVRALYVRGVDAAALHALLTEIERSIHHAPSGDRVPAFPPVRGYTGRFYPGYGSYLWTGNCNWWNVERLRGAGLAGRGTAVIYSTQVPGRLNGFAPVPID